MVPHDRLDEVLASRNGRPFVEATPELEEVAVMAAPERCARRASLRTESRPKSAAL
jgi:hypothetical protein